MRHHSAWGICYYGLAGVGILSAVLSVLAGACIKIPTDAKIARTPVIGDIVRWYRPYAEWLVIVAPVAVGTAELIRRRIGAPWVWRAVRDLLNGFEERMFRKEDLRRDEHSVTLFKYTRRKLLCRIPFGRWLVPVERSGNARRKSGSAFHVPECGGNQSEGIAGQVFSSERVFSVSGLPDLSHECSADQLNEYAEKTFVPRPWLERWVKKKRRRGQRLPLAICGFHVERSDGRPWGVIVLDSVSPRDMEVRASKHYDVIKRHLSLLVERI